MNIDLFHRLNPSLKVHTVIGVFIGLWGFLFAFFARPFEHGEMDLMVWVKVSLGYSLLAVICYLLTAYVQRSFFFLRRKWSFVYEVLIYIIFYTLYSILTFIYYDSPIISGIYNFSEHFIQIIVNIILIITPILIFLRGYSLKLIPSQTDTITLRGDNKLDILKIYRADLICISNAHNYVEIFFQSDGKLKSKLIRSTLKKIQEEHEFLIQIHRSHLINPDHFKSWQDSTTVSLSHMNLPVSKSYKNQLLSL